MSSPDRGTADTKIRLANPQASSLLGSQFRWVEIGLFLLGFVPRLLALSLYGMHNLDHWVPPAETILRGRFLDGYAVPGLAYFPFQTIYFIAGAAIGHVATVPGYVGLSILRVLVEVGIFLVLRAAANHAPALRSAQWLYWLSPFAIAGSMLGYSDCFPGLMLLVTVVLVLTAGTPRGALAAGLAAGVAALTKPQALLGVAAITGVITTFLIVESLSAFRHRATPRDDHPSRKLWSRRGPAVSLYATFLAGMGSSVVFAAFLVRRSDQPAGLVAGLQSLFNQMLAAPTGAGNALSANGINFWHVIATMREGLASHSLPSNINGTTVEHLLGTSLAVLLILVACVAASMLLRRSDDSPGARLLAISAVAAAAAAAEALVATRTHENHLLIAIPVMVLAVPAVRHFAAPAGLWFLLSSAAAANLLLRYGNGLLGQVNPKLVQPISPTELFQVAIVSSILGLLFLVVWLTKLWRLARNPDLSP
jgi:hypothetical protein